MFTAPVGGCLRYCKSTIFQANHNPENPVSKLLSVVCDTAKVRFFKQITTKLGHMRMYVLLFAILQKYDFSSKSQPAYPMLYDNIVVCDTAKVRFFKQITTISSLILAQPQLFAILQKYDFSSKSQPNLKYRNWLKVVCDTAKVRFFKQITTLTCSVEILRCCLRYCKSTIFQANHN